ncbi:MAG: uroporphyrinogen-III synthase [Deltaproteobacteria bacterium]|nr:uroporphyrinogen-III synthase [Deltaproteobacteria bacterium]
MSVGISALQGLRVLVTRPVEQANSWLEALAECGAIPVLYPTIAVHAPPSWVELDAALASIDRYEWILFSSASTVRHTLSRLPTASIVCEKGRQIGAVGEESARCLRQAGVRVDMVPRDARGKGLAAALRHLAVGTRILFPQAIGGNADLEQALRAQGCLVDVVAASQTLPIESLGDPPPFDVATFASPSALRAFLGRNRVASLQAKHLVVIGPTTASLARKAGLHPFVAQTPSAKGLLLAIAQSL